MPLLLIADKTHLCVFGQFILIGPTFKLIYSTKVNKPYPDPVYYRLRIDMPVDSDTELDSR